MSLTRYPPLPIRQEWAPAYLAGRAGAVNRDFAFHLADGQGTYPRPPGWHGAVDWFAPAGTPIAAPGSGVVSRTVAGGDRSGAVYGGILELTEPTGMVWVMRHVHPRVQLGAEVQAGDQVAAVHEWDGGWPHLHLEVWRSKAGGYNIGNMIDPASFVWDAAAAVAVRPPQRAQFWMEELPHTAGGNGPVVHGGTTAERAAKLARRMERAGELVSTIAAINGLHYVLAWKPGTHGERFRFGPWQDEGQRNEVADGREHVTGRRMRRFRGQETSIYPWPREG